MKVALLGPEGTFTHEAALEYFGEDLEPVFCNSIREVFESDITGFVPVENSLGGGVRDTIDFFREHDREVTGEQVIEIQHCLLTREEGEIDTVKSHPQALAQCSEFLDSRGYSTVETSSTAGAASDLGEGEAAIASRAAAEVYGLEILEEGIQDSDSFTRFMVLDGESHRDANTAIILDPKKDTAGLLQSMLGCLSGHGINLTHIESRPAGELGKYFFYVEAEVGRETKKFEKARKCLETYTEVKVVGSY